MKDHRERAGLFAVLVASAISAMVFVSMRGDVAGLFHDDGIYAVTARSLAAGTGYRIVSLPGAPRQTKYPVLYPYVLSWMWRASPTFPANILLLKSVNAFSAFAVMLLGYSLYRQYTGRSGFSALAYVILVGTNMLLVSCADFTLSDNLFEVFVMASILMHDGDSGGRPSRRVWWGAAFVAFGFLTRVSGAALIVAGVLSALAARSRRDVIVYAAIASGLTLPWLVWRVAAPEVTNPLLTYYSGYETPAVALLGSDPRLAWQIVSGNARYLLTSFDVGLLLGVLPGLRWVVYALVLLGSYVMLRRRPMFLVVFVAVYTGAVLNHPFVPGRYVMPLLPIVLLALFNGVFEAQILLGKLFGSRVDRPAIVLCSSLPIALLMTVNVLWLRDYNRPSRADDVRGFGAHFTYGWTGFAETFEWVRNHTKEDDVLATPYDPMYYLYTGRKAIRPWFHHPETYFYPVGRAVPDLGDPARIRDALNELGVRYLVIDPLDGYAERVAAPQLFERLLSAYPSKPRLVFTSHDSAHKVYDLRPPLPPRDH